MGVAANDEGGDTEGTDASGLGVALRGYVRCDRKGNARGTYLLDASDVTRNVFDSDGIFNGEAMALALYPCLVNQDATVGGETCNI